MTTTIQDPKTEECIETCNKMLRGERSAIETYDKAIEKFGSDPRLSELTRIRAEHAASVKDLELNIVTMGGTPDTDSGLWGTFAKCIQTTANIFGEESAVESLEKGEEKGLDDYKDALKDGNLMPGCHELYTTKLIPRVENHLRTLDRLEEVVD